MIDFFRYSNSFLVRKSINFIRFLFLKAFNIYDFNFKNETVLLFRKYLKKRNFNLIYINLIKNLDDKSNLVIDLTLQRINDTSKIIYANNLSKNELIDGLNVKGFDFPFIKNNCSISINYYKDIYPGYKTYEIPVFKFHHGLRLLDKKSLEYIKDKDAIDAGSFELDSAVVLSNNYNFKKIFSFEIDKINFKKGLKILEENYEFINNIKSINIGISNEEKIEDTIFSGSSVSQLGVNKKNIPNYINHKKGKVKVTTIDKFSEKNNLNLGYIKMDIEGAEYNALLGAKESIKKFLPIMSISIYHSPRDYFEIKPLIESIAPGEYDFYVRKLAPWYNQSETYLICIPKKLNSKILSLDDDPIYG